MANKRQRQDEHNETRMNQSQDLPARRAGATLSAMHPFGLLRRFANEIDDLFGDFGFGRLPAWGRSEIFGQGFESSWPQIDMFEKDSQVVIRADVPGIKKDDLHVEVTDDELTITGERKDEREEHKGEFYRSERSYGRFERRIPLPEGVNPDDVSCTFNSGTLEVRMKAPEQHNKRGRRVEIQEKGSSDKPEKAA